MASSFLSEARRTLPVSILCKVGHRSPSFSRPIVEANGSHSYRRCKLDRSDATKDPNLNRRDARNRQNGKSSLILGIPALGAIADAMTFQIVLLSAHNPRTACQVMCLDLHASSPAIDPSTVSLASSPTAEGRSMAWTCPGVREIAVSRRKARQPICKQLNFMLPPRVRPVDQDSSLRPARRNCPRCWAAFATVAQSST